MRKSIRTVICFVFLLYGCSGSTTESNEYEADLIEIVEITKWPDGFRAAFTPTLDAGLPAAYDAENQWLIDNGLFMDYEIVTAIYDQIPERVAFMRDVLKPMGFGYFGHGHAHDNHDNFDYEDAYASFRQNFLSIASYGFRPVAYAYPYGHGLLERTRRALSDSGFLSGRLNWPVFEGYGPCIIPGDDTEPPDWFALPALRMESYDFEQCSDCVNDPEEFFSYLDACVEQGAWLINTYHAIGFDGETDGRPVGWGFYRRHHFYEEMMRIKELQDEGIVWLARMSDATLYARQRHNASFDINKIDRLTYHLFLDDGLDRAIFHLPLTLRLKIDHEHMGKRIEISDSFNTIVTGLEITSEEHLINLIPSQEPYTIKIL